MMTGRPAAFAADGTDAPSVYAVPMTPSASEISAGPIPRLLGTTPRQHDVAGERVRPAEWSICADRPPNR